MMSRRSILTVAAVFLFLSAPAIRGEAGTGADAIRYEPYSYKTRDGRRIDDAEIGRFQVAENRAKPNGHRIELAFIRFRSTATHPGPPIIWLAGGPGDHGSDDIEGPYLELVRAFQTVADVIALDQRGTGLSRPNLECHGREIMLPLDKPLDPDSMLAAYREVSRECAEYWKNGVDLSAYNTEEIADDVDDLRQALGVKEINLYGSSYGSHLAFAVLRRHGDRIHRAVLGGVEGPDQTLKLPSNIEAHFVALSKAYRADPVLGDSIPDLAELMRRVLARLDREPVKGRTEDGRTVVMGGFEARLANRYFLGSRENMARLGTLYRAMDRGDFSALQSIALSLRKVSAWSGMHDCVDCASGATAARLDRIRSERSSDEFVGGAVDFPAPGVCGSWPYRDLGDGFRAPLHCDVPTLFLSGTLDGHTPPSNTMALIEGFPNGVHLIVERGSHQRLEFAAPGVVKRLANFLGGAADEGGRVVAPPLSQPAGANP